MKRTAPIKLASLVSVLTLMVASPAYAAVGIPGGVEAYLCLIFPLTVLLPLFTLWMLIDAIMRQEYEYPDSSGNSKLIWIVVLVLVPLGSVLYFFMVFRKIKRGSGPAPTA